MLRLPISNHTTDAMKLNSSLQSDEEEHKPLPTATASSVEELVHALLREQQEQQKEEVLALEAKMNQFQEDTQTKLNHQREEIEKLQRRLLTTAVNPQNRRDFSSFQSANAGGRAADDGYALDEDVFTLMMLNRFQGSFCLPSYLLSVVRECVRAVFLLFGIFLLCITLYILMFMQRGEGFVSLLLGITAIIASRKVSEICTRILRLINISSPWALAVVTLGFFQLALGSAIIYDQLIVTPNECERNKDMGEGCIPFGIPHRVGSGVTMSQYIAVILVLATQTDVLSSVQTIISLRNADNVPWDEVIGEDGNRTWGLWIFRILFPNILKLFKALVVLFASSIIIVQSTRTIDLLKDLTAILIISQADNILFYVADMGYLGEHLAQKTAEAKTVRWTVVEEEVAEEELAEGDHCISRLRGYLRRSFNIRVLILFVLCSIMIGGLSFVVAGQYNGKWVGTKYVGCHVNNTRWIGDGRCFDYPPYNSEICGFDGGDCGAPKPVKGYPNCTAHDPKRIGDGRCDQFAPYNTEGCGFDGGDCIVEGYPNCTVEYKQRIGDGHCYVHPPYKLEECGFDGGDCGVPEPVKGYPNCALLPQYHYLIGDGYCDDNYPYISAACGFDGGDCGDPEPVEKYPNCTLPVRLHQLIGDGHCDDYHPYISAECGFDGRDCGDLEPVEKYPNCALLRKHHDRIGDGNCHDHHPYNSAECGFDGGDCVPKPVKGYDGCMVLHPRWIGNGDCHDYPPYNTLECAFDGGDCIPKSVKGYDGCMVANQHWIGDGNCHDYHPYTSAECGFDGGDCGDPEPVEKYPNCTLPARLHRLIGNGYCNDYPPYNTLECDWDGGDCTPPSPSPQHTLPLH